MSKTTDFWLVFVIFLIANFAALGLGSTFTGEGVPSDWYQDLQKAPWTPPGWVFGAAWTLIMICFAFYMASLWTIEPSKERLLVLYGIQWILNVSWNPIFFKYHLISIGLITISLLTILVFYFLIYFIKKLGTKSLLIAPYAVWLLIATSLNAYILTFN